MEQSLQDDNQICRPCSRMSLSLRGFFYLLNVAGNEGYDAKLVGTIARESGYHCEIKWVCDIRNQMLFRTSLTIRVQISFRQNDE